MKISLIGEPEIIMSNPESLHNYFGWPTVTRLKNGELCVGASGFRLGHVCPFGKVAIATSADEGKIWSRPMVVFDTILDDRDAGLCPFGESGLIVTSFNNRIEEQREWVDTIDADKHSEKTKSYIKAYLDAVPVENEEKYLGATFKISYDNGKTFGKTFISPITSPHGPLELRNGTILWVGTSFDKTEDGVTKVMAYTLNLDGKMEKLGEIENPEPVPGEDPEATFICCEPYTYEAEDGTLICHLRVGPGFTIYQSVSKDGAKTWTKPEMILPRQGGAPSHIMCTSDGVLVATTGYRDAPCGVLAMFSYDNGKTWDINHRIYTNEITWDLGYPSTVELSDGTLLTVFYAPVEKDGPSVIQQQRWTFEK